MKILHCCLAAFYIDNYGYQENMLPKMHKLQGHVVSILASTETYLNNESLGYVKPSSYLNEYGIPVTRIPYVNYLPKSVGNKLRVYTGVREALEKFHPEVIFIHDCQFISIKDIARYAKKYTNTKIYVDSHTDFINSGKNWVSRNILHKVVYRWCAKKIEPYAKKFWGTLPLRMEFYKNVYGISNDKLDLLVLGADHTEIDFARRNEIRYEVRHSLGIKEEEFVIVTGGKIDRRKNIHILMNAVASLKEKKISIIVFGTPNDEMKEEVEALSSKENIKYVGWANIKKINNYFFAGDLGFFPGTHSTLWEQAVGVGLPCVFKRWRGIDQVDIGGNCLFIDGIVTEVTIKKIVTSLKDDKQLYDNLKQASLSKGIAKFSYYEIAKKAIES